MYPVRQWFCVGDVLLRVRWGQRN